MRLLRRILTGLVMAMVALLPVASHAAGMGALRAAAAQARGNAHLERKSHLEKGAAAHDQHAGMDCAEHRHRDARPGHQPCKDCAMDCCAPAIAAIAAPAAVSARSVMLVRRAPPTADSHRADASPLEHLRPPIQL